MATIEFDGLDALRLDMEKIAEIPDSVLSEMLDAQADVVIPAQKDVLRAYGVIDTGTTIDSITKGKQKKLSDGREISIYSAGTRTRGKSTTSNTEVLYVNEYGKRGQPARPAIRDANAKAEPKAEQAAFRVYDEWLKSNNI